MHFSIIIFILTVWEYEKPRKNFSHKNKKLIAIVIHVCDSENQELIFDTCIDIFARQGFTIHFFSVQQVKEKQIVNSWSTKIMHSTGYWFVPYFLRSVSYEPASLVTEILKILCSHEQTAEICLYKDEITTALLSPVSQFLDSQVRN